MKIGVLADTHVPDMLPGLPARVLDLFNGMDIILHAGDVSDLGVLQQLEPIAQTFAVHGDRDSVLLIERRDWVVNVDVFDPAVCLRAVECQMKRVREDQSRE
jgi:putative phosphoesterase